jgi:hypothetical protein
MMIRALLSVAVLAAAPPKDAPLRMVFRIVGMLGKDYQVMVVVPAHWYGTLAILKSTTEMLDGGQGRACVIPAGMKKVILQNGFPRTVPVYKATATVKCGGMHGPEVIEQ